jgi:hypothetical protein
MIQNGYVDLIQDENVAVTIDIVTKRQFNCRLMNDISTGALEIKECHRLHSEKELAKITPEKLRVHKLMASITYSIDGLHELLVKKYIPHDCTILIQSYLFQNGCIGKLKYLQNKENSLFNHCESNLLNDLMERHELENYTFKYEFISNLFISCQTIENKFYINNFPYSEDFISDVDWLQQKHDTIFRNDRYFKDEIKYWYS